MRTVCENVYKFDELSEDAKKRAIEWWLEDETFDFIYEPAGESLNEFTDLFNIKVRQYDFQEHYRSEYSFELKDEVLELSGWRLATYIWNNYGDRLFREKYRQSWTTAKRIKHPKVKSTLKSKETGWSDKSQWGEYWNVYHGGPKLEDYQCVFTGWCCDDDLLDPIYKFLNKPTNTTFKDLLEECLTSLNKSVQDEVKGNSKDEAVADTIMANYEFTEDGNFYK